ncbi:hypothetical protein [Neptuniibacter caesariensis]|uniref:Transferrin-binding protein B C-lobe/N-lobe beta barrel domain-containing protein n=1 Tax=Neptuniibacter caesariensis TaxID=207954 RepID=A0A7U8C2I3_NEPCE|nr:hypothetical protein [Neptuniibacter caesariensis]EAR60248.1 hypothetical protein MED92_02244 [Oceanospirillum sp. MED92] [Neptuniibacter caesariensis]
MWTRTLLATSVATALVFGASVNAAANKDDDNDSVRSWGPWNGVQTAAGPGAAGAILPPFIAAVDQNSNNTNSSSFDANFSENVVDNAGYREYMAWYSRTKHEDGKYERGTFNSITEIDGPEGRGRSRLDFEVGTEAGDQTYSPRVLSGFDAGFFAHYHDSKRVNRKKTNHQFFHLMTILNGQAGPFKPVAQGELSEEEIAYYQGSWGGLDHFKRNNGRWKMDRFNNRGVFIIGQTSSIDSVQNVLAGNSSVNYSGHMMFGGSVNITLNLGAAKSWSGSFNANFDNKHAYGPAVDGGEGGMVQFQVNNGIINGVDLSAVVNDNNVTGAVDASFFGDQAQHINGIVDVEHTELGDLVDVFQTSNTNIGPVPKDI